MFLARRVVNSLGLGVVLALAASCGGGDPAPERQHSQLATGSTCPGGDSVTYAGWAQGFFESYCTRCHSSTLTTTSERHGATPHANWDDLMSIRAYLNEIDAYAAAGPNGVNRTMPPSDPSPSDEERFQLGEWLACGAP